jgi:hypothetical protein
MCPQCQAKTVRTIGIYIEFECGSSEENSRFERTRKCESREKNLQNPKVLSTRLPYGMDQHPHRDAELA